MSQNSNALDLEVQGVVNDPRRSAARTYALVTIGEPSLAKLLRYELITGLFGAWPGAAGYALRRLFYRPLFAAMGRGVTIGRNCTFRGMGRITLGDRVCIDDSAVVDARGAQASIRIGRGVFVGRHTIIRCRGEFIGIGDGSDVGVNCVIATDSRLEIGRDVLVAAFTYVSAGGRHRYDDKTIPIIRQGFDRRGGSRIEDGAWIGAHSMVMDGVTVGQGTIVGAYSLVNKSLPPMTIAFGQPATVRKER